MSAPISPALQAASLPADPRHGLGGSPRPGKTGAGQLAMRVSDAERTEVADQLSRHYGEGRLDEGELSRRLDQVMTATTYGDLSGVLQDLPAPALARQPDRRGSRDARSVRGGQPGQPVPAGRRARGASLKLAFLAFLLILVVGTTHVVTWVLAPVMWVILICLIAVIVMRRRAR
jgi:uncharacterized protein DUF1707